MASKKLIFAVGALLASPTFAASMTGADFAQKAAATDAFELESSKLALAKSSNAKVKDFANMMIKDHTKSTADLTVAAKASSTPIDKSLDAEKRDTLAKLKAASAGPAWDKMYLGAQVKGHATALATMKDYAAHGSVALLKTFASNTSKVVEGHFTHVKALDAALR